MKGLAYAKLKISTPGFVSVAVLVMFQGRKEFHLMPIHRKSIVITYSNVNKQQKKHIICLHTACAVSSKCHEDAAVQFHLNITFLNKIFTVAS